MLPFSHSSIAGSTVTSESSWWKLPSALRRNVQFWLIISRALEASSEVANQLCQMSVMRSISGRFGAHHPIEPPAVVISPDVDRIKWPALVVVRRLADQLRRAPRPGQRSDRRVHSQLGVALDIAWPGPETGTPKQPRGLFLAERALGRWRLVTFPARSLPLIR